MVSTAQVEGLEIQRDETVVKTEGLKDDLAEARRQREADAAAHAKALSHGRLSH